MSGAPGPTMQALPLFLALLGGCSWVGAAEVYRWVDEQGVTQISQTPPASGSYQTLTLPSAPAGAPGAAPAVRREADPVDEWQQERTRRQEREQAALERKREREQRCQTATQNLTTLENLGARRIKMPDGSYARPSPEEVKRLMDQARAERQQSCD